MRIIAFLAARNFNRLTGQHSIEVLFLQSWTTLDFNSVGQRVLANVGASGHAGLHQVQGAKLGNGAHTMGKCCKAKAYEKHVVR
mmetsp:Transcript_78576/g.124001  ORF Transcript_78576/g.124001 Transcript_78576/m.124001 type:complete len:84 (-) Transcript_78576:4-255(-)